MLALFIPLVQERFCRGLIGIRQKHKSHLLFCIYPQMIIFVTLGKKLQTSSVNSEGDPITEYNPVPASLWHCGQRTP